MQDPDWVLAMQEELNNFKRNEVWSLVPRPKQNVVETKWVFHNKHLQLKSGQPFKEIIQWIRFLVTSTRE